MHRRCQQPEAGQLRAGDSSIKIEVGVQTGQHNSVPRGGPSDLGFVFPCHWEQGQKCNICTLRIRICERLLSALLLHLS